MRGHSNWVKNIEYDSKESLLVTSGFDGAIYTWDINQYQEDQAEFKKGNLASVFIINNVYCSSVLYKWSDANEINSGQF